ncbi:MAG TPA: MinD/ParA family protein [Chthoniobacteraceae bacterium]|nr:MinD/ParA family protein [Chthoniobacteraceae bacterium]
MGLPAHRAPSIEPARVQFIEREFADLLRAAPNGDSAGNLLAEIHDALFLEGRSIAAVRAQLLGQTCAARIIAVTSGKGGVGKTTVSLNMGAALAASGWRVLLFDADLGMANLHVFAGVRPRGTLSDVIEGRATLAQVVTPGPAGMQLICGASGVAALANLDARSMTHLGSELARFARSFDVLILDTGAGISPQVIHFLAAAHEIIVVATPNLASTLDAYGVIKVAREQRLPGRIHVVINESDDDNHGAGVFERLRECSQRFLEFSPLHLGTLRRDAAVEAANQSRQPLTIAKPRNKNARRFVAMAARLAALETSGANPVVRSTQQQPPPQQTQQQQQQSAAA